MSSYRQQQQKLFDLIEKGFNDGEAPSTVNDPVSDYELDNRICLTGVNFLNNNLRDKIIQDVIQPLKETDPGLFFYPSPSLHLTVQNIRTIQSPPGFDNTDIEKVIKVFARVIPRHRKINFVLKGLFELPTSIALKCFCDERLKDLVLDLRNELTRAGVPDNKRYASDEVFFGNITICRFPRPPRPGFFAKVRQLKDVQVGEFTLDTITLVSGNIVFSESTTRRIREFKLK